MRRTPPPGLREKIESTVLAAVERIGPDGLDKTACLEPFLDRDVARSTLFRWVDAVLASGRRAARIAKVVEAAAEARAARVPDPAADAAREAVEQLPRPVRPEGITGGVSAISYVQTCIAKVEKVIATLNSKTGA